MSIPEIREPTFMVLAALAEGRRHGYALIQAVSQSSEGRVVLRVGTLYAALERLQKEGLVAGAGEEAVDGRLRRYYELTDDGAAALEEEIARMERNIKQARKQLAVRSRAEAIA